VGAPRATTTNIKLLTTNYSSMYKTKPKIYTLHVYALCDYALFPHICYVHLVYTSYGMVGHGEKAPII
jgi:hypothetical protein